MKRTGLVQGDVFGRWGSFFFFLSGREEKEETEQEPTPDEVVRSEYPSQSEKEIPGKTKEKRRAKT